MAGDKVNGLIIQLMAKLHAAPTPLRDCPDILSRLSAAVEQEREAQRRAAAQQAVPPASTATLAASQARVNKLNNEVANLNKGNERLKLKLSKSTATVKNLTAENVALAKKVARMIDEAKNPQRVKSGVDNEVIQAWKGYHGLVSMVNDHSREIEYLTKTNTRFKDSGSDMGDKVSRLVSKRDDLQRRVGTLYTHLRNARAIEGGVPVLNAEIAELKSTNTSLRKDLEQLRQELFNALAKAQDTSQQALPSTINGTTNQNHGNSTLPGSLHASMHTDPKSQSLTRPAYYDTVASSSNGAGLFTRDPRINLSAPKAPDSALPGARKSLPLDKIFSSVPERPHSVLPTSTFGSKSASMPDSGTKPSFCIQSSPFGNFGREPACTTQSSPAKSAATHQPVVSLSSHLLAAAGHPDIQVSSASASTAKRPLSEEGESSATKKVKLQAAERGDLLSQNKPTSTRCGQSLALSVPALSVKTSVSAPTAPAFVGNTTLAAPTVPASAAAGPASVPRSLSAVPDGPATLFGILDSDRCDSGHGNYGEKEFQGDQMVQCNTTFDHVQNNQPSLDQASGEPSVDYHDDAKPMKVETIEDDGDRGMTTATSAGSPKSPDDTVYDYWTKFMGESAWPNEPLNYGDDNNKE